jgi:hypothetical protein
MPNWTITNLTWGVLGLVLVIGASFVTVGIALWFERQGGG